MTTTNPEKNKSAKVQLLFIFALFLLPVVAAIMMNFGSSNWRPHITANKGELLRPPPKLFGGSSIVADSEGIVGKWQLMLVVGEAREDDVLEALDQLGRVHLSTNKDMQKVQVLLLDLSETGIVAEKTGLTQGENLQIFPKNLDGSGIGEFFPDYESGFSVGIVDPDGFLVLRYDQAFDANDLKKDLKRLLRWTLDRQALALPKNLTPRSQVA